MKDNETLDKLIGLARRGRSAAEEEAPFGFATRVAARALGALEDSPLAVWERVGRWAVALAFVACAITVATQRPVSSNAAFAEFAGLKAAAEEMW